MRVTRVIFIILLLCLGGWIAPFLVIASDQSQNSTECRISQPAFEAINRATAELAKQEVDNSEALALIEEAKMAGWPPECDSVRARILADKALALLEVDETVDLPVAEDSEEQTRLTRFDGPWSFGFNAEFIEQEGINSASVFDSLLDDKYGVFVGKEFYRNDDWMLGGLLHIVKTNDADVDDPDELDVDSTSLFATARYESIPALQFKLGVSRVDYENFFERDTETGLAYGLGLTTQAGPARVHWLDYEVHRVGGEEFETVSVNLLVVICVIGLFFGESCWR